MKVLILFATLIAVNDAVSFFNLVADEWELFKTHHGKKYDSDVEEKFRMKIYMENKRLIARHNLAFERGEATYKMAMNHFGDLLHHEFTRTVNGFLGTKLMLGAEANDSEAVTFMEPYNITLPTSIDWREKGAVTAVKDQKQCGSCWAFSTTGSLEGQHFRKTGKLVSLSEQNLMDCSLKYGNNGCEGGLMDNAFKYIKENHGIDTESSYPYEAKDDTCRYKPKQSGATDKGFVDIPEGDEKKLQAALATVGPVSVAIDASQETFRFYTSGVYYEKKCSSTELDHGVLAVGYGTDSKGRDYWIVKNSWGPSWGDEGYIKMARNKRNNCGIATSASYPLV